MPLPHTRLSEEKDGDGDLGRMAFLEHLDELRSRLIRACLAIALGMAVSYALVDRISDIVLAPVLGSLPQGATLIMTRPGEGFAFYLDLCLIGGVVLAAPFVMYQAWRFIAPGLYRNEKRLALPFLLLATAGSMGGALFAHYLLFPGMMAFFSGFDSPVMRFMPRVEDTFALYKNILIGMVLVFQIPTFVFVLARVGVVTAGFLWRHFKHATLIAVIAGALLTPSPDPWNQLILAGPILLMYVLGIGIAWAVQPRRANPADRAAVLRVVVAASVLEQTRRRGRVALTQAGPRLVASRRTERL